MEKCHWNAGLTIAMLIGVALSAQSVDAADLSPAISEVRSVTGQVVPAAQSAWKTLATANVDQLTAILSGMKDASPLAENWLRSACDAVVERHLRSGGKLPVDTLRTFVLDSSQSPRARRSAYEWLVLAEPETPNMLLPELLNDPSLELRYDAVEYLLKQVTEAPSDDQKAVLLEQALHASRQFKQIQGISEQLKKLNRQADLTHEFGCVTEWNTVGPFPIADGNGVSTLYPPEQSLDLAATYPGKDGEMAWKEAQADGELGQLDFCKTLGKDATGVMYAVAKFNAAKPQSAQIRYETNNGTKLWLNGKLVAENEVFHAGGDWDQYVVPIQLIDGENTIKIKVCQTKRTEDWAMVWHFRLRVCDELGGAIHSEPNN
ncbi:MAG: hypothetical protein WD851_08465 [Pirellulales bacterium]